MLIRQLLIEGYKALPSAFNVEVLLAFALGQTREFILCNKHLITTDAVADTFHSLLHQHQQGMPLAYILGYKDFWEHRFMVTKDVLIPREDSEALLRLLDRLIINKDAPLEILDLGTGSGCLLISALHMLSNAKGTAVDISEAALRVCKINADTCLSQPERIEYIISDWWQNIPLKQFDIIITNPPYISTNFTLDKSVVDYEPHLALFAGSDGLNAYRKIAEKIDRYLTIDGKLLIEIGYDQEYSVPSIFPYMSIHDAEKDFTGTTRCLCLNRII